MSLEDTRARRAREKQQLHVDDPRMAFLGTAGGGGPTLSDEDPQDVGAAADPGEGSKASRDDHVHKGGGATTLVSVVAEIQNVDANSAAVAVFSGQSDLELIDRDNSFDPSTGTFLSARPNGTQFRITLMTTVQPYSSDPVKAAVGLYKNGATWVPFSIQRAKLPCASPLTYAQAELCLNCVISLQQNDTIVVKLINEHASDPTTFNSTWLTIEEIP